MTQQQYAQPYGQPQYPQPPAQQGPPQWAQPQQPPQWTPPGQPVQQYPPTPPAQPPVQGNLDDFFNQRSAGSGPGLSWKDKPLGFWYAGVVTRDVGNGDVEQQTDMDTGQPLFFKDGNPKFQLKIPIKQIQAADGNLQAFTDGEGTWYVKGQGREELTRAMAEAGCTYPVPKAGDSFTVQLVQRRPAGKFSANVVQINYTAAPHNLNGQQAQQAPQQVSGAPSPAPEAQQAPPAQQPPQDFAQQQYQAYTQPPAQPQIQQPPAQGGYYPPQGQAPAQPPAAPQQGSPLPPPPQMDPASAAILAQVTGQQPQQGTA